MFYGDLFEIVFRYLSDLFINAICERNNSRCVPILSWSIYFVCYCTWYSASRMIVLFVVHLTDETSHQKKISIKTPVEVFLVHHWLSHRCFPGKFWGHLAYFKNSYCLENLRAGVSQSCMNEAVKRAIRSL